MKSFLFFLTIFIFTSVLAQTPQIIRVQKSNANLLFFQKGKEMDTITNTEGNVFYLIVRDTLKDKLTIFLDNAQLIRTSNDSIFRLNYIRGTAYDCVFMKTVAKKYRYMSTRPKDVIHYEFKCLVNGASSEDNSKIIIRFKQEGDTEYLLENTFWYKE
jgi:hypothetical protein